MNSNLVAVENPAVNLEEVTLRLQEVLAGFRASVGIAPLSESLPRPAAAPSPLVFRHGLEPFDYISVALSLLDLGSECLGADERKADRAATELTLGRILPATAES